MVTEKLLNLSEQQVELHKNTEQYSVELVHLKIC